MARDPGVQILDDAFSIVAAIALLSVCVYRWW
jgi:hypothetical protein